MLVLTRREDQTIVVAEAIKVMVVRINNETVRIGVQAPDGLPIHRQEVAESIRNGMRSLPQMLSSLSAENLPALESVEKSLCHLSAALALRGRKAEAALAALEPRRLAGMLGLPGGILKGTYITTLTHLIKDCGREEICCGWNNCSNFQQIGRFWAPYVAVATRPPGQLQLV